MSTQHHVITRDRRGSMVKSRTFADRSKALRFADAQLTLEREVELITSRPAAVRALGRSPEADAARAVRAQAGPPSAGEVVERGGAAWDRQSTERAR